jgi:hypothetical protein
VLLAARDLARALTTPSDAPPATCRKRLAELEDLRARLQLDEAALEDLWGGIAESWRQWGDAMRVRAQQQVSISDLRAAAQRIESERSEVQAPVAALADAALGLSEGADAAPACASCLLCALRARAARSQRTSKRTDIRPSRRARVRPRSLSLSSAFHTSWSPSGTCRG